MQSNNTGSNIVVKLLTSSRLRIFRHLILFILTLSISAGFVWFAEERGVFTTSFEKCSGLLFFTFLFQGANYLNIYLLTPKLLFKNKWGIYFCSLFGIVVFIMAVIIFVQGGSFKPDNITKLLFGIVNLLSSSISLFLLSVGTSTLVLFKYWILDMQQAEELESATLQMELKLLENQINPHFLFNMLNNANIMIKKDPDVAVHIIEKLEEMLYYLMDESIREKVYMKDEIMFLNDFLELEKTRRDFFSYTVSVDGELDDLQIPPLLFITFVENAVKHNQDSKTNSYVNILFKIKREKLVFICENSIPQRVPNKEVGGIGLTNIERRLNLLFGHNYSLEHTQTETKYSVKLELKL